MKRRSLVAVCAVLAIGACGARSGARDASLTYEDRAPLALLRVGAATPASGPPSIAPPAGRAIADVAFGPHARLVATTAGLFVLEGGRWSALDRGGSPVADVVELASGAPAAEEAWVREGQDVWRVRVEGARSLWYAVAVDPSVGHVRALGAAGAVLVLATDRGVAVLDDDDLRLVHRDGATPPAAIASDGVFAWIAWGDSVLRTDGFRWTRYARDLPLATASLTVSDDGAAALVTDAHGEAWRVVASESMRLEGLEDGARVADTRLPLAVVAGPGTTLARVRFLVDGHEVAARTSAPWGWGTTGAPPLDLARIGFGSHAIHVDATTSTGATFTRDRIFTYAPPAGGVPSYARDVAPIFRARCASCHVANVAARDLATYDRLRDMSARVRASVREQRMPPDFALDSDEAAIFTAWVDGDSPP